MFWGYFLVEINYVSPKSKHRIYFQFIVFNMNNSLKFLMIQDYLHWADEGNSSLRKLKCSSPFSLKLIHPTRKQLIMKQSHDDRNVDKIIVTSVCLLRESSERIQLSLLGAWERILKNSCTDKNEGFAVLLTAWMALSVLRLPQEDYRQNLCDGLIFHHIYNTCCIYNYPPPCGAPFQNTEMACLYRWASIVTGFYTI